MKCKDCKYYSCICGTIFCSSKNHKRKTVRIDKYDAEKDLNCLWSDDYDDSAERELAARMLAKCGIVK